MPFKSKAQERFFYARLNAKRNQKDGPSKEVAEKFIKDSADEPEPKVERFSKLKKKMKSK